MTTEEFRAHCEALPGVRLAQLDRLLRLRIKRRTKRRHLGRASAPHVQRWREWAEVARAVIRRRSAHHGHRGATSAWHQPEEVAGD